MTIKQLWTALITWLGRGVSVVDKVTESAEYIADIGLQASKSWHSEFEADFAETEAKSNERKANAEAKAKAATKLEEVA